jgi:hypothetical protein
LPQFSHGTHSGEPAATVARSVFFVTTYSVTKKYGQSNVCQAFSSRTARRAEKQVI